MIIIGEKINGTIPVVKDAIERRDADFIADRAVKQVEAGADYIDVCASTSPDKEIEALRWLMDVVQNVTDVPLCVDSPDPRVIEACLPYAQKPGLINSISGEGDKCDVLLPLMKDTQWGVVGLTCDNDGIPKDVARKLAITRDMVERAAAYGVSVDRMYIDPCVMALSAENAAMLNLTEEIKAILAAFPGIHVLGAISNISFGVPARKLMNTNAMTLAISAGMDAAVMDPTNRDMMGTIYATEALLGRDRLCRNYSKAFRKGKIGPAK